MTSPPALEYDSDEPLIEAAKPKEAGKESVKEKEPKKEKDKEIAVTTRRASSPTTKKADRSEIHKVQSTEVQKVREGETSVVESNKVRGRSIIRTSDERGWEGDESREQSEAHSTATDREGSEFTEADDESRMRWEAVQKKEALAFKTHLFPRLFEVKVESVYNEIDDATIIAAVESEYYGKIPNKSFFQRLSTYLHNKQPGKEIEEKFEHDLKRMLAKKGHEWLSFMEKAMPLAEFNAENEREFKQRQKQNSDQQGESQSSDMLETGPTPPPVSEKSVPAKADKQKQLGRGVRLPHQERPDIEVNRPHLEQARRIVSTLPPGGKTTHFFHCCYSSNGKSRFCRSAK